MPLHSSMCKSDASPDCEFKLVHLELSATVSSLCACSTLMYFVTGSNSVTPVQRPSPIGKRLSFREELSHARLNSSEHTDIADSSSPMGARCSLLGVEEGSEKGVNSLDGMRCFSWAFCKVRYHPQLSNRHSTPTGKCATRDEVRSCCHFTLEP